MKRPILLSLLFSAGFPAATLNSAPAMAQVTSNDDALPAAAAPSKSASGKTAAKSTSAATGKSSHASPHKPSAEKAASGKSAAAKSGSGTSASQKTPASNTSAPDTALPGKSASPLVSHAPASQRVGLPPDVPEQPPRPVVIPPPGVAVPTHPPVPPEEIKADPDAKGKIEKQAHGLRVLFDANSSAMNQAMIDAVREEARQLAGKPTLRVTLWASASGTNEDLSTPRRVALARALAIRSILIREGVATTRIYPRATGLAHAGTEPADRLDIIAEGAVPAPISEAQFGTASRTPTP
ncbi:OmpA family protein [Asaia krungthepensis]|uniref:OmpA-like domain-containing protein n=1 Tax=Asaia krungthepensis NRIC 0535 TaxID=1307925 RepID=A0ABQ0PW47_9PROT|nr:hypothetical protein [Asaia krungthepensis]GBQ83078.1 hypothetical protein AA0535_0155 [Asaia krungthepensis NRIC 0535]